MTSSLGVVTKIGLGLVVIVLTSACAELQVKKIEPGKEEGTLTYCLLVPKLQVTTKQALVYDKLDLPKPPYARAAREVSEQTITLVQVPSYEHYYSAKVKSGWFTADSYSITYDPNGCLNSYTFTTVDQTGTVITTVASIALAAAVVAAAEATEVTYPEPSADTYLIDRSSRKVLNIAEQQIEELLKKGSSITDQERDKLNNLLEKAAKLRDLLNPKPTQIVKVEFVDLRFIPASEVADKYVVRLMKEAEMNHNANKFIPVDQNGREFGDFIIGIARRIK